MKKTKTGIGVMLALLCCILMCTGVVYATGDDTDGTELQVAQPVILEVQLGPQWAGVEFQLKTDAGLYPGTIAVGQDGILRTELGNSGSYVLSCLTLNAAVPAPGDIPSPDVTQQEQEPLTTGSAENADAASQNAQEQDSGRPIELLFSYIAENTSAPTMPPPSSLRIPVIGPPRTIKCEYPCANPNTNPPKMTDTLKLNAFRNSRCK